VAISSDGSRIFSANFFDQTVRIWNAHNEGSLPVVREDEGKLTSVSFSPDGKRIVTGHDSGIVCTWDASSGKLVGILHGHESRVASVAFSPDGKRIASGSSDKSVRIWDASDGKLRAVLSGHESGVESVAFSPDGKRIASGSSDQTVRIWDAHSGESLAVLCADEAVRSVAFSPDGARIGAGSGYYRLLESDDDRGNTVRIWDSHTGERVEVFSVWSDISRISLAPVDVPFRLAEPQATVPETLVEDSHTGCVVARYPERFGDAATHPNGSTWAGAIANQLCILTLEGNPDADRPT
jgi:WD40 repeat protein